MNPRASEEAAVGGEGEGVVVRYGLGCGGVGVPRTEESFP